MCMNTQSFAEYWESIRVKSCDQSGISYPQENSRETGMPFSTPLTDSPKQQMVPPRKMHLPIPRA